MKKILTILLAALFIGIGLSGCKIASGPVTYEGSMEIPEDAIVSAKVLKQLKSENKAVTFTGESGDVRYEWVLFGSNVGKAEDIDLGVEIIEDREDSLSFEICGEEAPDMTALLLIRSHYLWTEDSAKIYKDGEELSAEQQLVSVSGAKTSVLSVPVLGPGNYEIRAYSIMNESSSEIAPAWARDPDHKFGCTISIECATILNDLGALDPDKLECVPGDGYLLKPVYVEIEPGENAYDVLQRVCAENGIHMEAAWTPLYDSYYIEGIGNLYEFDCGGGSGWMYRVNGWYPNFGCSAYNLSDGDIIEWRYTCAVGEDIGGAFAISGN
jgi:hypothetical protein